MYIINKLSLEYFEGDLCDGGFYVKTKDNKLRHVDFILNKYFETEVEVQNYLKDKKPINVPPSQFSHLIIQDLLDKR